MFVIGILIIALISILIYKSIKIHGPGVFGEDKTPEDILKARYARGELSQQVFRDMMNELTEK